MTTGFYLALTPWLTFVVADRSAGIGPSYSAMLAVVVSALLLARDVRQHSRHLLPVLAFTFFGMLAAVTAGVNVSWMIRYDRSVAVSVLTLVLLGSTLREPLTSAYFRESLPPKYSMSSSLESQHLKMTWRWSVALAGVAASFLVSAVADGPVTSTLFDWLLPIALIIVTVVYSPSVQPMAADEAGSALSLLESLTLPADRSRREPSRPRLAVLDSVPPVMGPGARLASAGLVGVAPESVDSGPGSDILAFAERGVRGPAPGRGWAWILARASVPGR